MKASDVKSLTPLGAKVEVLTTPGVLYSGVVKGMHSIGGWTLLLKTAKNNVAISTKHIVAIFT